jgi:hypothetical protein
MDRTEETLMEETLIDHITGREIPDSGAEANRQEVERLLLESKGYAREDIEVDAPIVLNMGKEEYRSFVDLVVHIDGWRYMVIKCAPGSLASREREVIAAARLLCDYQIPQAAASDGRTAIVWDTVSGRKIGDGPGAIPSKQQVRESFDPKRLLPLAEIRRARQQLIFRSYDIMNVNKRVLKSGR